MPVRLFSVDEANALIASLNALLERAQEILARMRHARDQLIDLRIIWGDTILEPACADHLEYENYQQEFARHEADLASLTEEVSALGCELKDLELGLVDFAATRGEEVVYLCWKKGERHVGFWHPVSEGYAGRQPLQTF